MKCKIQNCDKVAATIGMCNAHYLRKHRYGRIHSVKRTYGTGSFRKDGYKLISHNGRRILEHRLIMELSLGRPLSRSEIIHHLNHDPQDNRLENLVLTTFSQHPKYHVGEPRKPFSKKAIENMQTAQKKAVHKHQRDHLTGQFVKSS